MGGGGKRTFFFLPGSGACSVGGEAAIKYVSFLCQAKCLSLRIQAPLQLAGAALNSELHHIPTCHHRALCRFTRWRHHGPSKPERTFARLFDPAKMPTPESELFKSQKPTVPPTFNGVDYDDHKAYKAAEDAIIREQWVNAMMIRLTGEELGKCYKREGVNHLENCGRLRGEIDITAPDGGVTLLTLWKSRAVFTAHGEQQDQGHEVPATKLSRQGGGGN